MIGDRNDIHPLRAVVCQSCTLDQVQVRGLNYPNLDVLHLSGYLRHHLVQYNVHVVDAIRLGLTETVTKVRLLDPHVFFIHANTPAATATYQIVNKLKEDSDLLGRNLQIMIFGEHASALPLEAFERSRCDGVLQGDPEPVALAICQAIADTQLGLPELSGTANLIYRKEDGVVANAVRDNRAIDLDGLPLAARDLVDLKAYPGSFYKLSTRETSVLAARGCPWHCTFCGPAGHRALEKPRFRFRSPKSIVDELEWLQCEYQIDDFMLDITTFNFNDEWSEQLCHEIIDRGLKLNLKSHLRADRITPCLLSLMRRAGFWLIFLGIESANDHSLTGIKKQISIQQVENALAEINRAGIKTVAELMNLLFWEENGILVHEGMKEARKTLRFARRMFRRNLIHAMYWTPMTPVPASATISTGESLCKVGAKNCFLTVF